MAPTGLSTPVNGSANSENVVALAAIRSSSETRDTRQISWVCGSYLSMIVDSGAEVHLVCPAHKHFLTNVTKLSVPLQLETAGGDLTLDVMGDLLCGGIVCHGCVFNPVLSVSLFSAATGEKDGCCYEGCPEGYGVLKGPRGNVKLERSGGLDFLVGGEGQHVFPAVLTHGSVDGGLLSCG